MSPTVFGTMPAEVQASYRDAASLMASMVV